MRKMVEVQGTMVNDDVKRFDFNAVCYSISFVGMLFITYATCFLL